MPLIWALSELMQYKDGQVTWKTDPEKFIRRNLAKTLKVYHGIIQMANYDPQKVGNTCKLSFSRKRFPFAIEVVVSSRMRARNLAGVPTPASELKEEFCRTSGALLVPRQLTQGLRAWAKLFRYSGAVSTKPVRYRFA